MVSRWRVARCRSTLPTCSTTTVRRRATRLRAMWQHLPGSIGLALTDGEGRFVLDRLPDRATFRLTIQRPEFDKTRLALYAATIDGLKSPPGGNSSGGSTAPCPTKSRRATSRSHSPNSGEIVVSVVGDDTQ